MPGLFARQWDRGFAYLFSFSPTFALFSNIVELLVGQMLNSDKRIPRLTHTDQLVQFGLNGSLRYGFMGDRPANEDNSVVAKGYFVTDAAINYTQKSWEAGIAIQNLFDTKWKETQFNTESRLQNEPAPVSEIHFTPGTPFFAKANFTLFF